MEIFQMIMIFMAGVAAGICVVCLLIRRRRLKKDQFFRNLNSYIGGLNQDVKRMTREVDEALDRSNKILNKSEKTSCQDQEKD